MENKLLLRFVNSLDARAFYYSNHPDQIKTLICVCNNEINNIHNNDNTEKLNQFFEFRRMEKIIEQIENYFPDELWRIVFDYCDIKYY